MLSVFICDNFLTHIFTISEKIKIANTTNNYFLALQLD